MEPKILTWKLSSKVARDTSVEKSALSTLLKNASEMIYLNTGFILGSSGQRVKY